MRNKGLRQDLLIACVLVVLALLFFWPVTLGGKTLLPADNAFAWQPWQSYADQFGITVPHNSLLSDLYLENFVWKRFIVESLRARQLPLWNPYLFAGVPFLAAGQHSALYPLSVLFYVLPLPSAYGWFAALHLFLAGILTYILARTLRVGRMGSLLAGITFMFCGFFVTHNVFPMIVASVVWLPLILAMIERIVRRSEESESPVIRQVPDLVVGVLAFGMVFLAGHAEMYYYVCLISGAYALWRLVGLGLSKHAWQAVPPVAGALLLMVCVGVGLGGAQWLPYLAVLRDNFRAGSATLRDVLGWAYPPRHVIAMFIPDFYGNPAHHTYLDLFTRQTIAVTVNGQGQPIDSIFWGIKNYVEGASYVGLLPVLLAIIAILRRRGRSLGFMALMAFVSLLFVYGSPLYALVYKLPGLEQVHSPFRWIFPYSLCMAVLAGMGLDALNLTPGPPPFRRGGGDETPPSPRWRRVGGEVAYWADALALRALPVLTTLAGAGLLAGLALSLAYKERIAGWIGRLLPRLAKATEAFADGRMAYSYEFRNLLIFGIVLLLSGTLLLLRDRLRRPALWGGLACLIILGELFVIGKPFFPAVERRVVSFVPPSVAFLKRDAGLYRITSFVGGGEKTFNANAGMLYDIADIRGYDSIIPRQYVEMMRLIHEQGELPYNRIAPIAVSHADALDAPLLDMLNVKYVLTTKERTIPNAGYALVYDDEVRIYRNENAMPRAFLIGAVEVIPAGGERDQALRTFNPREVLILEETPAQPLPEQPPAHAGVIEGIDYTPNEVKITLDVAAPCFLVLGDSYYPGWVAYTRPYGSAAPDKDEQALPIYRANGNFRAVQVSPGRQVVRFKYTPNAVKYGLYVSFLSGVILLLGAGTWAWLRFYRESQEDAAARRVTKNTVAPITLTLINRIIDMAFAMLMLRILTPADAGRYYFAIMVISWFDIITNFGLNTLLTREVAKDRKHANAYLTNTTILRLGLCVASVPMLGLFFLLRRYTAPLDHSTLLAISLFMLALLPSNISAGISAMFNGYERMEIPAFVTTLTTVLKVVLGTMALIAGTGFVGLAGVSIGVNLGTVTILYVLLRKTLFHPRLALDWGLQKRMLRDAYPLMINNLLATLFFKIAVLLLEWLTKDYRVVGWYSTAYKYIDAIGVIPAYFTMAIFPLMARYAANAKGSLLRAYRLSIKLLLIVAVPGALLGWSLSSTLITILGGPQYLPYAARILEVMIWFMPLGFINSVTQYVLIALDQQRFLTRAFAIGLAFNVVANLTLISRFGYMASAYVAIASELALLIPFYVGIRRHLAPIPWAQLAWKQAVSAAPMITLVLSLPHRLLPVSVTVGLVCYGCGLAMLRVFDAEEQETLGRVLPLGSVRDKLVGLVTGH